MVFLAKLNSVLLLDQEEWEKKDIKYLTIIAAAQVLFPNEDSKYFVDMSLKSTLDFTLENFEKIKKDLELKEIDSYETKNINQIIKSTIFSILGINDSFQGILDIKQFVKKNEKNLEKKRKIMETFLKENFFPPGNDIENYSKEGYFKKMEEINFLKDLKNEKVKKVAKGILEVWPEISKKGKNGNSSSLIPLPHPFFVPGGRFREFYYWDSYWILEGLLICKMEEAAKNLVKNFINLILKFGFIPNGSRYYYSRRTQPPVFSFMLKRLLNYEKKDFFRDLILNEGLQAAEMEHEFFEKNRKIEIKKNEKVYKMFFYNVTGNIPRPESLKEDFENWFNSSEKESLFEKLKSSAESGIDFSSRWFENPLDIKSIDITNQIPVDLNAIMYKTETILGELFCEKRNFEKAKKFYKMAEITKKNINEVLWDEESLMWKDFKYKTGKSVEKVYFSNFFPMLFGIEVMNFGFEKILEKYANFFFGSCGGVPAGEKIDGVNQQWDFPNVWAPYNHLLVEFLISKNKKEEALSLASKFFQSVSAGFEKTEKFLEKYNCDCLGKTGDGGEYDPQTGFGWTNGAVLSFIQKFGDDLASNLTGQETNPDSN